MRRSARVAGDGEQGVLITRRERRQAAPIVAVAYVSENLAVVLVEVQKRLAPEVERTWALFAERRQRTQTINQSRDAREVVGPGVAHQPTIRPRPSQNGLRNSRRRILPEALRGMASTKSTVLGTL